MRTSRLIAGASVSLALWAAPSGALGAEGGGGSPMDFQIIPFIAAILVFGIAFFILNKTAWPKIVSGLEEREKKIREEIYAAEQARKAAQQAQEDYGRELANARAEAQRMIEQTKAEQSRMAADLRLKAEAELNQMRESAMRGIEAAKRAALREIYAEAATLSTQIASKILQREVNEDDQRRLVEESLSQFAGETVGS